MMMVFQDPYASLNARKRVGFIIGEALELHGIGTPAERKRRVQELLEVVGLNPEHYNRFPHEFSGGQRQRIGVARALAVNPKLIVCDEPVSALDVSVQAQILNLLKDLQKEFGLTYVFIAHDLNVVRHISDRVMVMYLGKAVEVAEPRRPVRRARSTRTRARCSPRCRSPTRTRPRAKKFVLEGDVPNPINPPAACNFHPRCPRFHEGHCDVETPRSARRRHRPHGRVPLPAREVADDGRGDAPRRQRAGRPGRAPRSRTRLDLARRAATPPRAPRGQRGRPSARSRRWSAAPRRGRGPRPSRSRTTSSAPSCSCSGSSPGCEGRCGREGRTTTTPIDGHLRRRRLDGSGRARRRRTSGRTRSRRPGSSSRRASGSSSLGVVIDGSVSIV